MTLRPGHMGNTSGMQLHAGGVDAVEREFGDGRTKEDMEKLDTQCRIRAFNRNRSVEDQVSTIEEIEKKVGDWIDEIPNS